MDRSLRALSFQLDVANSGSIIRSLHSGTSEQREGGKCTFPEEQDLKPILRKVSRTVLPLLFLVGMLNYLDRSNLSFAALELNQDVGISSEAYGFASGCFFLGYGVFMIPSTYMTMRYGARVWYSTITILWGVIAGCGALINSPTTLYVLRFFLGAAESGAASSAWHLLCLFYPEESMAQPYAVLTLASIANAVISGPLAAGLLSLQGAAGLAGWQWLFIIEAVPTIMLGVAMAIWLPSTPLTAWMLTPDEREMLHAQVHKTPAAIQSARQPVHWHQLTGLMWEAMQLKMLWFMTLIGFLWVLASFSLNAWMPIIVKNMLAGTALANSSSGGPSDYNNTAALLSAVPYVCAACSMLAIAWHADRVGERTLHFAMPYFAGGVVLACFTPLYAANFAAGFVALVINMMCAYGGQAVLVTRTAMCLTARTAGVGLSIFNAVCAAIGGFVGPFVVGALVQQLGTFSEATIVMGVFLAAAGLLGLGLGLLEWRWTRVPAADAAV